VVSHLYRAPSASLTLALLLILTVFITGPSRADSDRRSTCVSETSDATPASIVDRLVFEPRARGLPQSGQWRDGFAIADMNEDGRRDIVHGAVRTGVARPTIFLAERDGGWTPWVAARFAPLPFDYGDVAVGDFDADGHADLALAVHLRGIAVLHGDGKGGFRSASERDPALGFVSHFSSRAIDAVDMDADGRPEIVALGEGPSLGPTRSIAPGNRPGATGVGIRILRRADDGSWAERIVESAGGFGMAIATADLDGDARIDIVAASSVTGSRALFHLAEPGGGWTSPQLGCLPDDVLVWGAAVADFDLDRRNDVVLTTSSFAGGRWTSGVDLLVATDSRVWQRRSVMREAARIGPTAVAAGDLDNDGRPDVVFLDASGRVRVLLGSGDGTFSSEKAPEGLAAADGCRGYDVAVTDVDSDGFADIVAAFAGEPLRRRGDPRRACPTGGRLAAWKTRLRTPD